MFFTKPADAVVADGAAIPYPSITTNLHHEVELVIALGAGGSDIDQSRALECIWGYGVGVDLTRRDLQAAAKDAGGPWDAAKAFDNSAPIGALTPANAAGDPARKAIRLSVNGAVRQNANTSKMIWTIPEMIAALSRTWALQPGDLIFTGTPSGVGPLVRGDTVLAEIQGLAPLRFTIN